jgi:hypothetical protein
MAIKQVKPKTEHYGVIDRGASLVIPVKIIDPHEKPIDLTDIRIAFTIKKVPFDYDMADDRAYVQKDFEPQDPENGKFYIQLSSKDLDFEPGKFYFDIELYREDGMVFRIVNLEFTLVGGPTNRTINTGTGQLLAGDEITIIEIDHGRPIVIIASIMPDASVNSQLERIWSVLADIRVDIENIINTANDLRIDTDYNTVDLQNVKPRLALAETAILNLDVRVTAMGG